MCCRSLPPLSTSERLTKPNKRGPRVWMLMFTLLGPCPPIHGNADTILGHFGDGGRGDNIFPSELPCSKTNTGFRGTHGIEIIPPQWKKKTMWEPSRERDGDCLKRFDIWKLLPSLYIEHQPVGLCAALYKSSHDPWTFLVNLNKLVIHWDNMWKSVFLWRIDQTFSSFSSGCLTKLWLIHCNRGML